MLRCVLILAVLLCFTNQTTAATPAASPDPKSLIIPEADLSRARDLVQKLGSEVYVEREEAELSLVKMGRLARPALLDGANNDLNAEIRSRCQGLLPKATTQEMKARLAVFLADAEGKFEHDLAGWNEFRTLIRRQWTIFGHLVWADRSLDNVARTLFADMNSTQANRQLLFALGSKQSELGAIAGNRRQDLYWGKHPRPVFVGGMMRPPAAPREPTLGDILTLLLLEVEAGNVAAPRGVQLSTLLTGSFSGAAQAGDDRAKACRAVVAAWFDSRTDGMEMYQAMNIAPGLGLPEYTALLAARLIQTKGATPAYRGMAAATLVRSGNKSHLSLLEKAFDDKTVVTTVRKPIQVPGKPLEWETHDIQMRDVALVVSLILTQQKPEDYWFVDQYRGNGAAGANYNYSRYWVSDTLRDMALAKWSEWREKNP